MVIPDVPHVPLNINISLVCLNVNTHFIYYLNTYSKLIIQFLKK